MLSVVIPIYNEELLIDELLQRTSKVVSQIGIDYELIIIDDGSSDNTLTRLIEYQKQIKHLKILQLSKNFGHSSAITAGLSVSQGDYIVIMDGDLQDPPEIIYHLYKKITSKENLDVVYAQRTSKKESFQRKILMSIFHKIFKTVSTLKYADDAGNFSIMSSTAKNAILLYTEKTRYIPGLRMHIGFNQEYIQYERDARYAGQTKMNYSKLFTLALDALFSFSHIPIRTILILGILGLIISGMGFIYVFISKYIGIAPYGWSSNLFFTFLFHSLEITFIGIIGEYIFRIYKEVQNRPLYIIKKTFE